MPFTPDALPGKVREVADGEPGVREGAWTRLRAGESLVERREVPVFDPVMKTPGAGLGSHTQTGQIVLEVGSKSFV